MHIPAIIHNTESIISEGRFKQRLFNHVSNRTDGLRMNIIWEFVRKLGSSETDLLIFDVGDYQEVAAVFEEFGWTSFLGDSFKGNEDGRYFPEIELVLIRRNREAEQFAGSVATERNCIHEFAHATSRYKALIKANNRIGTARAGFIITHLYAKNEGRVSGSFLEEAFAEFQAAEYTAHHTPDDLKTSYLKSMGYPPDFTLNAMCTLVESSQEVHLPLKYVRFAEWGGFTYSLPALPALALELMMSKQPGLLRAMKAARYSVDGLRETALLVDLIKPGLYRILSALQPTYDDYSKGLEMVIEPTHGRRIKVNDRYEIKDLQNNSK